jgi:uncharacterized protein YbaA (DUF1428 family)
VKEDAMTYIDGYVIPVPRANREAYKQAAESMAPVFKQHGALKVVETWGDDIPKGKNTDFYMAVKCSDDETVVFSWIVWRDKAARDAGMAKAMADPRMHPGASPAPFDGKRMIFGGFEVLLEV